MASFAGRIGCVNGVEITARHGYRLKPGSHATVPRDQQ
jgi:hypothetical protein